MRTLLLALPLLVVAAPEETNTSAAQDEALLRKSGVGAETPRRLGSRSTGVFPLFFVRQLISSSVQLLKPAA